MGQCSKCGAETHLYEYGNPICIKCAAEIDAARKRIWDSHAPRITFERDQHVQTCDECGNHGQLVS
jgi:uncharacterized protein with PIN domain